MERPDRNHKTQPGVYQAEIYYTTDYGRCKSLKWRHRMNRIGQDQKRRTDQLGASERYAAVAVMERCGQEVIRIP